MEENLLLIILDLIILILCGASHILHRDGRNAVRQIADLLATPVSIALAESEDIKKQRAELDAQKTDSPKSS